MIPFPASTPLPAERAPFVGREAELTRLETSIRHGLEGAGAVVAVAGTEGVGKSALLRRAFVRLVESNPPGLPVWIDLSFATAGARDSAALWNALLRELVRQIVAADRRLPLDRPPLLGASPELLAQLSYGSGLGPWAETIRNGVPPQEPPVGAVALEGILRGRADQPPGRVALAIDGLAALPASDEARGFLRSLVEIAAAERCVLICETDCAAAEEISARADLEVLALGGLSDDETRRLLEALGGEDRRLPDLKTAGPTLRRLGGLPETIRAWHRAWSRQPDAMNPDRRCEEAWLDALENSAAARRLAERLHRAAGPALRPRALETLAAMADAPAGRSFMELPELIGRLGLDADSAASFIADLSEAGFLVAEGSGFALPRSDFLRDWVRLNAAPGPPEAARALLLRRLLTERQRETESRRSSTETVPELLREFSRQEIPQALVRYDQYFEALGAMPAQARVEALKFATHRIRLPEVVGVIAAEAVLRALPADRPRRTEPARIPSALYYAYAYRGGVYQRSHEETWIVGDFSRSARLTTSEIDAFLNAARDLERSLGPGRYVPWLVAGEAVSPEALERIEQEKIYCSAAEQVRALTEFMKMSREGHRANGRKPSAGVDAARSASADRPSVPVIAIDEMAAEDPEVSVSRLGLVAREENEVIAAMMAEKIAARLRFDAEEIGRIRAAVLEGCLNAIEHSLNSEKEIQVYFIERPEALEIAIENEGQAFDPLSVPEPDPREKLDSPNKRGWGIKLMREFMDDVIVEPLEHGTRLRLIKRRTDSAAPQHCRREGL